MKAASTTIVFDRLLRAAILGKTGEDARSLANAGPPSIGLFIAGAYR